MNARRVCEVEVLPSGKTINRRYDVKGALVEETHSYGILDVAIQWMFEGGIKTAECYFANRRMVSRKTYETRRLAYPDMPPADMAVEDFSGDLMRELRAQQRSNLAEAEDRLKQSAESRFPRPKSTNWLRVIAGETAHLVEFASRDWKALSNERELRTGREWLGLFGFHGGSGNQPSIHKDIEVGFEVTGDRDAMLGASKRLLTEVTEFAKKPPEPRPWLYSVAPRPRTTKKKQPLGWSSVLPPLIEFLSALNEPVVKIFNHHR
jgi:hypothetical protein